MKKHITSLPHHPVRVIVISLILAAFIGAWSYQKINVMPAKNQELNSLAVDTKALSASHNLTLGFLSGGRIKTVSVKAGDRVKKDQLLASLDAENVFGALRQAKAAYATAQANYQKVINGATGPAIAVAKAGVNTAKVNLEGATSAQTLLVKNAKINLLNSTLIAKPQGDTSFISPSISGTYIKDTEGTLIINVNQSGGSGYFTISGIESGTGIVSTTLFEPIGDTGLFIKFPSSSYQGTSWNIDIPNTTASNYLPNYNAYQQALETKDQVLSGLQAALDQANANLAAVVTAARPEDVASAQAQVDNAYGTVEIAQGAYKNTIITAPSDGIVTSVDILPGQIAIPNVPAILFISSGFAH